MPGTRRSTDAAAAQARQGDGPVSLGALFTGFLTIAVCGVGGGSGIVWARRVAVERRRWIGEAEFVDIVGLCQFMPGPNIIGIAVSVGTRTRGAKGALAALGGFLVIPWTVGLSLGLWYLEHARLHVLRDILGGIAPVAAGLLVATGLRLLLAQRRRPAAWIFAGLAFGLVTVGRLPLLMVLLALVPISVAVAGRENAGAR